jgi:glycosyltransferase involved in cell wall biosynthesis
MDILILFSGKYPGFGAASKRVQNYQKGLQLVNNEVIVLSVYFVAKNVISVNLQIFIMPFFAIYKLLRIEKAPEILFVYGFGWISKLFIVCYAKLKKIKVVFEVNEKPYSIVGSRRDYVLKYFSGINNWMLTRIIYKQVDGFVVISENLKEFVLKFKSGKCRVIKIPVIVDYENYQKQINGNGGVKPYIFHSATLNDNKDGVSGVIEAWAIAVNHFKQPIHFYLTSRLALNSTKNRVQTILETNNLTNYIHYLGDIDEDTLMAFQQNCAMVIINKVESEQNLYNFATKIGEYSALGKPIITTQIGEVSNYFQDNVNCFFVPQNNPNAIAEKIVFILKNPEASQRIGNEAKKTAFNEFDYKHNCEKLDSFFKMLLQNTAS